MPYKNKADKVAYDKAHPEQLKAAQVKYRAKPSSKARLALNHLRNSYGLVGEAAVDIQKRQLGPCDICGRRFNKPLHIDHNHQTKVVRGVLCPSCNVTVGMIELHLELLPTMLKYIGVI